MPIIKLAGMLMRSLSKPIATHVKSHLQDSPTFAKTMTGVGKGYQRCVNMLSSESVTIDQIKAIEQGSEIVVETFLFSLMAGFVVYDHMLSKKKSEQIEQRLAALETKLK